MPVDSAIVDSPTLQATHEHRRQGVPEIRGRLDMNQSEVERARDARRTALGIPHRVLLGGEREVGDIAEAFRKMQEAAVAAPRAAVRSL